MGGRRRGSGAVDDRFVRGSHAGRIWRARPEARGDPARVLTLVAFDAADTGIQVHTGGAEGHLGVALRELATLVAQGQLTVSISQTYALTDAAAALSASTTGHGHGKLVVVP